MSDDLVKDAKAYESDGSLYGDSAARLIDGLLSYIGEQQKALFLARAEIEKMRAVVEWAERVSATHSRIGSAVIHKCQCGLCRILRGQVPLSGYDDDRRAQDGGR